MKAWKILSHALRQVFGNFGAAVRVSLLPFVAVAVVSVIFGAGVVMTMTNNPNSAPGAGMVVSGLAMALVYVAVFCTIAVNWHRYVLLNEPVGWIPAVRPDLILVYFGTSLAIWLGFSVVVGLGAMILSSAGTPGVVIAVLAVVFALSQLWRISAALPGVALGESGCVGKSITATNGETGTLIVMTLIYLLGSVVAGLVAGLFALIPVLGFLVNLAFQWLTMMVALSVLTTLYGHYVEGRELT